MPATPPRPLISGANFVTRALVGGVLLLVRAVPRTTRETCARAIAAVVWALGVRRQVAVDNVSRAFPELPTAEHLRIARGAFTNMALAALEAVTSDLLTDVELQARVLVDDWKGLDRLLAQNHPVLVASAHFGSWELFAEVMARRGTPFSAVVRPLTGAFNEWVVRNRQQAGVELILQRGALTGMLKALKRGRAVVQLVDQSLPAEHGVFVPFFGRLASTTPAVSMVALRSGAPVYVVMAAREGTHLRMFVEGPVPLPELPTREEVLVAHTATLTAIIEGIVRRYPEQWLWLHRRWKETPTASPVGYSGRQ